MSTSPTHSQPPLPIDTVLEMAEIDDGKPLADPLFRHRYGSDAPDFPCHVFAFARNGDQRGALLCYIHFTAQGNFLLGGGACVDNRALRLISREARDAIRAAGGLYRHALAWSVQHFSGRYQAIFGYCGDALAERVDLDVGFRKTGHEHLLVHFSDGVSSADRERLIEQAHAVGPF
ncbi:MAG: hypothetical protein ABIP56_05730 [Dokdonella sp.]